MILATVIFNLNLPALINKALKRVSGLLILEQVVVRVLTCHLRADTLTIAMVAPRTVLRVHFSLEADSLAGEGHRILLTLAQMHLLQVVAPSLPLLLTLASDRVKLIVLRVFVVRLLLMEIVFLFVLAIAVIVTIIIVKLVRDIH